VNSYAYLKIKAYSPVRMFATGLLFIYVSQNEYRITMLFREFPFKFHLTEAFVQKNITNTDLP